MWCVDKHAFESSVNVCLDMRNCHKMRSFTLSCWRHLRLSITDGSRNLGYDVLSHNYNIFKFESIPKGKFNQQMFTI